MGVLRMELLSLKRLSGQGIKGDPLQGILEDMLRKAQDTDISHHRSPFEAEGNLESGRGARIRGIMKDE